MSDDLLDLGVDSVTSVELSAHLSKACGHDLPSELVLTHPTAIGIADFVASLGQSQDTTAFDGYAKRTSYLHQRHLHKSLSLLCRTDEHVCMLVAS